MWQFLFHQSLRTCIFLFKLWTAWPQKCSIKCEGQKGFRGNKQHPFHHWGKTSRPQALAVPRAATLQPWNPLRPMLAWTRAQGCPGTLQQSNHPSVCSWHLQKDKRSLWHCSQWQHGTLKPIIPHLRLFTMLWCYDHGHYYLLTVHLFSAGSLPKALHSEPERCTMVNFKTTLTLLKGYQDKATAGILHVLQSKYSQLIFPSAIKPATAK